MDMRDQQKSDVFCKVEGLHLRHLDLVIKAYGEKSLPTARSHFDLAKMYTNQEMYKVYKINL